jgi:hypothetical protein
MSGHLTVISAEKLSVAKIIFVTIATSTQKRSRSSATNVAKGSASRGPWPSTGSSTWRSRPIGVPFVSVVSTRGPTSRPTYSPIPISSLGNFWKLPSGSKDGGLVVSLHRGSDNINYLCQHPSPLQFWSRQDLVDSQLMS